LELWYFYNKATTVKRDAIPSSAASLWIQSLNYEDLSDWLCWKAGYVEWVALFSEQRFAQDIKEMKRQRHLPPPPPPLNIVPEAKVKARVSDPKLRSDSVVNFEFKKQKAEPIHEKRKSERVTIKLRAVLTNRKNTFITFTKNISTTGILTENEIPAHFFTAKCEIYITGPQVKESIVIQCIPAGKDNNRRRLQFAEISDRNIKTLSKWIYNVGDSYKKVK
jgi:hypothetical protein